MKTIFLALALTVTAMSGAAAGEQAVTIANGTLQGSLLLPDQPGDAPAVLVIAGSGPTDRDGNSAVPGVKPASLKLLAEGLAANGIASLRFDKRGIAASAGAMSKEADLRLGTYVEDAVVWAEFLKSQTHRRCIYILGHSEGALIGALAAARTKPCGFISIAGAGMPLGQILLRQLKAANTPAPLLGQAGDIVGHLEKGEQVAEIPPALATLFRPSVQPYLISHFTIDPAKALRAVRAPILVLQGTTDIQVSVEDAQMLAKAAPRAKLVLLEGVNHVLKTAPAERSANLATYSDPTLPLAPRVVAEIVAFVRASP